MVVGSARVQYCDCVSLCEVGWRDTSCDIGVCLVTECDAGEGVDSTCPVSQGGWAEVRE